MVTSPFWYNIKCSIMYDPVRDRIVTPTVNTNEIGSYISIFFGKGFRYNAVSLQYFVYSNDDAWLYNKNLANAVLHLHTTQCVVNWVPQEAIDNHFGEADRRLLQWYVNRRKPIEQILKELNRD